MTKKISKKSRKSVKRISSIQRTIEEGNQFFLSGKRRKERRDRILSLRRPKVARVLKPSTLYRNRINRPIKKLIPKTAIRSSLAPIVPPIKKSIPKTAIKSYIAPKPQVLNNSSVGKTTKLKPTSNPDVAIPSFGYIDVCFCVDATGSMMGELAQVQSTIQTIINNIEQKVRTQGLNLRFAIVTYRDHPPQDTSYVTKILDFTDNYEAIKYVKTLNAWGGGDEPQAVHDGLMDCATKLNWAEVVGAPTLRYVFHIADAPPHGKEFKTMENKNGCLCGMQTDDVLRELNKKQIHYRLIKVRNNYKVDEMEKIFREKLHDIETADIQEAKQMNLRVSDMIIHEVIPDFA